jgi:hypothetical protein
MKRFVIWHLSCRFRIRITPVLHVMNMGSEMLQYDWDALGKQFDLSWLFTMLGCSDFELQIESFCQSQTTWNFC